MFPQVVSAQSIDEKQQDADGDKMCDREQRAYFLEVGGRLVTGNFRGTAQEARRTQETQQPESEPRFGRGSDDLAAWRHEEPGNQGFEIRTSQRPAKEGPPQRGQYV